jgi:hypothetical protein
VQERTGSKCIGTLPPNTIFGPAIEVKYVNIPADNGVDLEPGVAVLVDSKLEEMRPKFVGRDIPQHVWINVLKSNVQFASYQGNPVLTQRKIESMKEKAEKAELGDARGNPGPAQDRPPLMDQENADEKEKLVLKQTAD